VLPGGVAILLAVFEALGLEQMTATAGSMREGLLYDLLGRIRHEDVRDGRSASSVSATTSTWARPPRRAHRPALPRTGRRRLVHRPEHGRQVLGWAARLHEIGLSIAYAGYHRHSAYLVANSDMPGFSRADQDLLAAMLLGQRKKLTRDVFSPLPAASHESALRLCVLLRLAVRLARSRSPRPLPPFTVTARKSALELSFPADWIEGHPLTHADLAEEADKLQGVGFELKVR
jgi:exopolyphosphatase/guanosine-5'-triphosphate,3'-diphosphate pyrophosphatase